jgi:hypothetical protein
LKAESSLRKDFLKTFAHKPTDRIVYSPRIYYWYLRNRLFKKHRVKNHLKTDIPERFLGKSQIQIYDLLDAAPRYTEESLYLPLLATKLDPNANIEIMHQKGSKEGETITIYKTPIGMLSQTTAIGGGLSGHYTEFPIKTIEDLKIMRYIMEHTNCVFLEDNFQKAEDILGNRGVASTYLYSSPYQRLMKTTIGFTRTTILLKRNPKDIEDFMIFLGMWDDKMYELIVKSPLKIVNFGENIDANLSPPPVFEKYLLPYYQKRVNQLKRVGIFTHIHIDGSFKDLLPYFEDLPFDGLEALTPYPQGDVNLEELSHYIGDKILLDGIPSILFLPHYSYDFVEEYTRKVLDLFSPNLILGVSDELSPNGDIVKLERIRDIINKYEP